MSSEMREFENLTNVKDGVKDSSDYANDAKSDIADLRRENTKGTEKIVNMKKTVSNSPDAQTLDTQQKQELASLSQIHRNNVGKLESSTQMCLVGGINDMMNPDYFRDFLITAGESPDKQRPSYTDYITRLQKGDTGNQLNIQGQSLQKRGEVTQSNSPESIAKARSKAAELIGSVSLVGQNESTVDGGKLQKDAGVAPGTQQYNILTANAMRGSGGIQDSGPVSTGFQNVPLSRPKAERVPDTKPKSTNRIAST